jgi:outer membrane lipoprotein SlyB
VAYAQIAGLPPAAGLMAAPGAMLAYALLGTSRQLVVGATTATAAVSAATVGGLADGNAARFAALRRNGVALVIARDIGQVRDVLRTTGADAPLVQVYPTIQDALDAIR